MRLIRKAMLLCASAIAMVMSLGAAASAQVDIVTVTTQKREQTLSDVPVAVTAITAETLQDSAIRDLNELEVLAPSLNVVTFSRPGAAEYTIRGLGTSSDNAGLEPSVGVFVDGVYRARQGAAANDFFSLERVEVIRGPQSTLFGRNTPAGVISFHTRAPEFETGAAGEFTYGNYNQFISKGTVTGPLIQNQLAFRLDGVFNKRDGVLTNRVNEEAFEDVNNRNRFELRGQLLWERDDLTTVRLIADYSEIDEDCCAAPFLTQLSPNRLALGVLGANLRPDDPFRREVVFDGRLNSNITNSGVSAEVTRQFANFEMTSITAFRNYEDVSDIDADFTDVDLVGRRRVDQGYDTFTQEVRFAQNDGGQYDWLAGGYLYYQSLNYDGAQPYGSQLRPFVDSLTQDAVSGLEDFLGVEPGSYFAEGQGLVSESYDYDTFSLSGFGQADYYVNERLTVTGGLRLGWETKDVDADIVIDDPFSALDLSTLDFVAIAEPFLFDRFFFNRTGDEPTAENIEDTRDDIVADIAADAARVAADPFANPFFRLPALQFNPPASSYSDSRSEFNVAALLRADYEVNDNLNLYASLSRGYKAGGFNLSALAARDNATEFDEETATSIEFGLKSRFAQDTVLVNFAAFDTSLNDFQANSFTGSSFQLVNAGEVTVRGLELETDWNPNPYFLGELGLTYLLDAEYDSFENAPCNDLQELTGECPTGFQDLSGRQLAGASKTTVSLAGTVMFSVNGLNVALRNEGYFRSAFNTGADLDPRKVQDEYFLYNATLTVSPPREGWALQLWGKNLLQEEYIEGSFSSVGQPGSINAYVGDPRTYGLTMRLTY